MESKVAAIIVVVAAMCPRMCPLTSAARVQMHVQSRDKGEVHCPDGMFCTAAPCEIENSNKASGPECACLPGFTGQITWRGSTPSGSCTPAPCEIVGTEGAGLDCQCMFGLTGTITWKADVPQGECLAEAFGLFKLGVFQVQLGGQDSIKRIKCCTSWAGKPTELQDVRADSLPSVDSVKVMGLPESCSIMFGDTYHDAVKVSTCPVAMPKLMKVTGLSLGVAMEMLRIDKSLCDIENSNMAAGSACACLPGFTGQITWQSSTLSGACKPATCGILGTAGSGLDCQCTSGPGTITWKADVPQGHCIAEAFDLFKSGVFQVQSGGQDNVKDIKCCVSSKGHPTELQDINADPLPSIGAGAKRMAGDRQGCGYMFGDSYHSALKRSSCPVALPKFMQVTGLTSEETKELLNIK